MSSDEQISLFNLSEPTPPSDFDPEQIPTDRSVAIPPGTYSDMATLARHCNNCQRCALAAGRTHAVIGRGSETAQIMIVGEGPGQHEDETGLPFVGRSGQLLEKILESVRLSEQDIYVANIVKCLEGSTRVLTRAGAKRLNWIVKHQWSGEVLSADDQGHLVWKRVTGWHQSRLEGRPLYRVSLKGNKANHRDELGYTATGDHPVLTRRGWIAVEDLQTDDLIATGTPAPGPRGLQILLGSLLGNGSIAADGQFQARHSLQQAAYLKLKARVLAGLSASLRPVVAKLGNGNSDEFISLSLLKTPYLHDLRQQWYPDGKKQFPHAALTLLNPLGLAIWYLDHGDWRRKNQPGAPSQAIDVEIALGNLSQATAEQVAELFTAQGYQADAQLRTTWRLCLRSGAGRRFLEQIAPYVPACLRHKLPEELHQIPFNAEAYQPEPVITHWQPVSRKPLPPKPDTHLVYCIDVEDTANFVTPAGVVHNCRPPENRTPTTEEAEICKGYLLEQIRMVDPQIILLTGATAVRALTGNKQGITKIRGEWLRWDERDCMPIFHPAYLLRNPSREKGSPKWLMWQDIQKVRQRYDEIRAGQPE